MGSHRPPAPVRPSRLWLGLMTAAVTGMVVGTVAAGHAAAPKVAADEHLALTPERTPEPVAHGGPLQIPSIGAVESDPVAYLPPVPVVHTSRPAQRPSAARQTTRGSTGARPTVPDAPSATEVPSSATPAPTVSEPTQAATVATTETAATTDAATTTTEATTTSASTTSETATATVDVTVSATETTTEAAP